MTDFPEYFLRPPARFYLFEWTGSNLADLQDFIDEFGNNVIHPVATGTTLRVDQEGGGYQYFNPGDKMILEPNNWIEGAISDQELAYRYGPIANRP